MLVLANTPRPWMALRRWGVVASWLPAEAISAFTRAPLSVRSPALHLQKVICRPAQRALVPGSERRQKHEPEHADGRVSGPNERIG